MSAAGDDKRQKDRQTLSKQASGSPQDSAASLYLYLITTFSSRPFPSSPGLLRACIKPAWPAPHTHKFPTTVGHHLLGESLNQLHDHPVGEAALLLLFSSPLPLSKKKLNKKLNFVLAHARYLSYVLPVHTKFVFKQMRQSTWYSCPVSNTELNKAFVSFFQTQKFISDAERYMGFAHARPHVRWLRPVHVMSVKWSLVHQRRVQNRVYA